jgi:hypothetical protein
LTWENDFIKILLSKFNLYHYVQARLERIWSLLRFPIMPKLDMVIKYTSPEWSHHLEAALHAWEYAAAAVLDRERVVADLERLAAAVEAAVAAAGGVEDESDIPLTPEETHAYLAMVRGCTS